MSNILYSLCAKVSVNLPNTSWVHLACYTKFFLLISVPWTNIRNSFLRKIMNILSLCCWNFFLLAPTGAQGVTLSICLSSSSLSRAFNLHLQEDFKKTLGRISGKLQNEFRMIQDDFKITQSTQRALKEQESNQTSSYHRSLKYFVLLTFGLQFCKSF